MIRAVVWTGVILMLVGLILFFIFVGTGANCGSDGLAEIGNCRKGSLGLHVGFVMVACGALSILAGTVASVRSTARARRR